jgi:site-specific DNA recombinase
MKEHFNICNKKDSINSVSATKCCQCYIVAFLASVAQQEVQNTSEHVKKGLSWKMSNGELVGFNHCLGYNYDPEAKSLSINESEAETVRYIFSRYNEGAGATVIGRELEEKGIKSPSGNVSWHDSTIIEIIKNEKYKGDLIQGKTYTIDPISKKRCVNNGKSDKYLREGDHPAIVTKEAWEEANEILKQRSYCRKGNAEGNASSIMREQSLSSMIVCGF